MKQSAPTIRPLQPNPTFGKCARGLVVVGRRGSAGVLPRQIGANSCHPISAIWPAAFRPCLTNPNYTIQALLCDSSEVRTNSVKCVLETCTNNPRTTTKMPYPFPKDDESFEGSSDPLIDHVPYLKKRTNRTCHLSLLRISLVTVAIAVAIIEMIVLETIFIHLTSHDQSPQLLSELNKLVPECRLDSSICSIQVRSVLMLVVSVRQVLFRKDSAATWDHRSEESRNATRDDWLSYFPRTLCYSCLWDRY